jgi:hypothetical protein
MRTAFFYHVRLSGGKNVDNGATVDPTAARSLFLHQATLMANSFLLKMVDVTAVFVNGHEQDYISVLDLVKKQLRQTNVSFASVFHNGQDAESLLPTMRKLQEWLPGHEGWAVGFAHMKGVTHFGNQMIQKWADCLNHHTITNWRQNVADLESGQYDACGCHWTHNSPNDPNADRWGANSYFAGGFWWATADYLLTLPKFPTDKPRDRHEWFYPELWLGNGCPRVRDYHPGPVTNH